MILQREYKHGGFMEVELMDINDYVVKLLNNRIFRKNEIRKFVANDYTIEDIDGIIGADLLYEVISKAKRNKELRMLLPEILGYIKSESMSDKNFIALLSFSKKYRETYLSCIGHTELSFYQMQKLNEYPLGLEAFSWLFDKICKYDIFTNFDMLHILSCNPDVKPIAIKHFIEQAQQKYGDSTKLNVAKQWVDNMD